MNIKIRKFSRLYKYLHATYFRHGNILRVYSYSTIRSTASDYNVYKNAAITANSEKCAQIGRQIMKDGGSVADAAIATLLCGGVRNPERMGLGGGFILTIYHHKIQHAEVLIAREKAPAACAPHMYISKENLSLFGGLAVCIPGSLMGYWELHSKYGKLPWHKLFEPSIQLCQTGIDVEPFTRYGLRLVEKDILKSSTLRQILVDPFTGKVKTETQKIFRHQLANTLQLIADNGPYVLYNGQLTSGFVKDIQNNGGIITEQDMNDYRTKWLEPLILNLQDGCKIFVPPLPTCGPVLLFILNILSNMAHDPGTINYWHAVIEAWKHAYGFRSHLGDPEFSPNVARIVEKMLLKNTSELIWSKICKMKSSVSDYKYYGAQYDPGFDTGTAHFNFVHENGDAVAVTESINTLFGAMFKSISTGIILNNSIDDFSLPKTHNIFGLPPSEANALQPNKTPLSSMVPTIVTDSSGQVRLLLGGAGGTKIITAVSLVLLNILFSKQDVNTAVDALRLHHQLMPMVLEYETKFSQDLLTELQGLGHSLSPMEKFSTVNVISREDDGFLHAKGDVRRNCATSGY